MYLAIFVALAFGVQFTPVSEMTRWIIMAILILVLFADTIDIMLKMKKDERETVHEAIAERNAMWVMILVLVIGIAYQTAKSVVLKNSAEIDPIIIIALFSALIAKAVTNYYLDRKN
jgi:predicted CDP-diglyceride synthetase/phosphatidate cytidylyltransferase